MTQQTVPPAGWGAQPSGSQAIPTQQPTATGFGTAPPAGFGATGPQQPQQQPGPGGYVTTPPPTQIMQPTPAAAQQPQQPQRSQQPPQPQQPLPAQRQLFPTTETGAAAQQLQQPQQPQQPQEPAAAPSIQSMLRAFSKQADCDRYSGDAEKVKLLEQYLWCRQLMPGLTFEVFLNLYGPVANFDDENLKHPSDAIKKLLPRQKKQAEAQNTHHWSSKEVVDYVALYVDMIREAEQTNAPIPLTFNQFLVSQNLLDGFHAGAFKEEPAPKEKKSTGGSSKPAAKGAEKVRPTSTGQRVIHTNSSGRQFRGVLTNYWQDAQSSHIFCDFHADSGEEFKGIGLAAFELCSDPPPNPPQDNEGHEVPELGRGKLTIVKAQFPSVLTALEMNVAVGTVAIGDNIYSFNYQFETGHVAVIDVVNGESGPYVDARLCITSPDNVLFEVNPPRKNIEGTYTFEIPEGSFSLEVVGNR